MQKTWILSLGWEDLRRRKWQLTPVFLPGKSHGQRSLAGYSPRESQRVGHDWAQHPYTHTFVLVLFLSTEPQTAWKAPLRKWFLYSQDTFDVCVSRFSPHPPTLQFSRQYLGLITHFWHELPRVGVDPTDWLGTTGLPTSIPQFKCQLQVPGCELYFWPTGHKLEVLTPHSQSSEKHFIYVEWFIIKNITKHIDEKPAIQYILYIKYSKYAGLKVLRTSVCSGVRVLWALGCAGFRRCNSQAPEDRLNGCGARVQLLRTQHVKPSWIRDGTHVSCIGRRILTCQATRETPKGFY